MPLNELCHYQKAHLVIAYDEETRYEANLTCKAATEHQESETDLAAFLKRLFQNCDLDL